MGAESSRGESQGRNVGHGVHRPGATGARSQSGNRMSETGGIPREGVVRSSRFRLARCRWTGSAHQTGVLVLEISQSTGKTVESSVQLKEQFVHLLVLALREEEFLLQPVDSCACFVGGHTQAYPQAWDTRWSCHRQRAGAYAWR